MYQFDYISKYKSKFAAKYRLLKIKLSLAVLCVQYVCLAWEHNIKITIHTLRLHYSNVRLSTSVFHYDFSVSYCFVNIT